jgi:Kef-type K+ transport system membrane component KefB
MVFLDLSIVILLVLAGRWVAVQAKQPPVLGELLGGLVFGNVAVHLGGPLTQAAHDPILQNFSNLGVVLLLFSIGLETNVRDMFNVGHNAVRVAVVGVIIPFLLALLVGEFLLKDAGFPAHLFLAATLCATSIGITARVFQDLKKANLPEARVILGAAVIDDVLGLIILTIVAGVASSGSINSVEVAKLLLLSTAFIGVVLFAGPKIAKLFISSLSPLDRPNARLLIPLLICFLAAWLAEEIKLASIVGAFAAGLMIQDEFFGGQSSNQKSVKHLMEPLEGFFAPIFFVLIGMQVDLSSLLDGNVLILVVALTVAAVLGKIACGWAAGRGYDKLTVGIGMIPRGEVGLIFASVGKSMGVLNTSTFSALVIMVFLTTFMTPPALGWALKRAHK